MGGRGSSSRSNTAYRSGRPQTGQRMVLSYIRNTQSAPAPYGMDFGQDLEPAGQYMNVSASMDYASRQTNNGWETGYIEFMNPLVLEHVSTGSNGWKRELSELYGGRTGRALTNAIKRDGYDAIVTIDTADGERWGEWFNEVVNISGRRVDADKFKVAS